MNRFFRAAFGTLFLTAAGTAQQLPPSPPSQPITWKDEIARNFLPYHQLTASDFRIDDKAHPDMDLWIRTFTQPFYHYEVKQAANGMIYTYVTEWTIFAGFDKNESCRSSKLRDMKAGLPYAQAMLDINEMYARKLAALKPGELPSGDGVTVEQARFRLDDRLTAFCRMKMDAALKETQSFAEKTKKGQNQRKVRELGAEIKRQLNATPPILPLLPATSTSPAPTLSPSASPDSH